MHAVRMLLALAPVEHSHSTYEYIYIYVQNWLEAYACVIWNAFHKFAIKLRWSKKKKKSDMQNRRTWFVLERAECNAYMHSLHNIYTYHSIPIYTLFVVPFMFARSSHAGRLVLLSRQQRYMRYIFLFCISNA